MRVTVNLGGVIVALFVGFLVSALFGLSFAWCFVIGVGAVPALLAVLSVLIWILERPFVYKIERFFSLQAGNRRKRKRLKAKRSV